MPSAIYTKYFRVSQWVGNKAVPWLILFVIFTLIAFLKALHFLCRAWQDIRILASSRRPPFAQ